MTRRILVAALAALTLLVAGCSVESHDSKPPPPRPAPAPAPPPPGADARPKPGEPALRDETPPGAPQGEQRKAEERQGERRALEGTEGPNAPQPVGGAQSYSCRSTPVRSYSSRNGARPGLLVWHYTVSANRPGWGDVNAIVGLFRNVGFGASSNYVIDLEGHCARLVPESAKAWTQGAANPWSISIEMIGNGRESKSTWDNSRGVRVAAAVFRDAAKRWGIPIREGAGGCSLVRSGIVDHDRLSCNDHTDIRPFSLAHLIALTKTGAAVYKYGSRTLAPGSVGDDVARLQRVANAHRGKARATARDGEYGADTERVVDCAERRLGFPASVVRRRGISAHGQGYLLHPTKRPADFRRREVAAC